jgi:hypothetical protein
MRDQFSEFSKGSVVCKYQMVERVGNYKRRDLVFVGLLICWIVFWIWVGTRIPHSWAPIMVAFLPFLIGEYLFSRIFRYRTVGLVTFQGSTITFARDGTPEKIIDLRRLQSLRVFRSIPRTFQTKVRTAPRAYGIVIRTGDAAGEYHVLNEMYVTKADELQFMAPPPPLSVTLSTLMTHFKIRFYDLKGREMDVIP